MTMRDLGIPQVGANVRKNGLLCAFSGDAGAFFEHVVGRGLVLVVGRVEHE